MKNQSKQMVTSALIKVINAAPRVLLQRNYMYPQTYQNNDVSMQEFSTWMNYANQVLDISYNHTGLNDILSTKVKINQLYSQYGGTNTQHIVQIKQELFRLMQVILQY